MKIPTARGHSAMVANGGIASNSSHSLPVVQALDVPFLIVLDDWGGYSTYALIRKNEYYMRRNLIQISYGTNFGGMQRYTNNPSQNRCGQPSCLAFTACDPRNKRIQYSTCVLSVWGQLKL